MVYLSARITSRKTAPVGNSIFSMVGVNVSARVGPIFSINNGFSSVMACFNNLQPRISTIVKQSLACILPEGRVCRERRANDEQPVRFFYGAKSANDRQPSET